MKKRSDYIRVTQVLSPFTDFSHIPIATLENAAKRGSRVHKFCEQYIKAHKNGLQEFFIQNIEDDIKNYCESFVEWFENTVEDVHTVEQRYYNDELRITGQIDLIAKLKGDTNYSVIDFKTPASESLSWALQTAAYMDLAQINEPDIVIDRRICLMLPKNKKRVNVVEYTQHLYHKQLFANLLELNVYFEKL